MKGMLKWPLIIAAILVIGRIILEQAGAPGSVNNLFSVVILYVFVAPLYFAFRIANSGVERPYRTLLKKTALFTALARSMVIPTYWLAYHYQWTAPRFTVEQGGNVGPNVTPVWGYVLIPLGAAVVWILISLVVGGGLGSLLIKLKRRTPIKVGLAV
jgi:hypothetical protein